MGLEKAIISGKEHRKPFRGAKAVSKSCRNHGGGYRQECPWCLKNRTYRDLVRKSKAISEEHAFWFSELPVEY